MVWNEKLKREIPEGWNVVLLSQYLETYVEKVSTTSINPNDRYAPIEVIPRRKMSFWECSPIENAVSGLCRFQRKHILLSNRRVYFHKVCIAAFSGLTRDTVIVLKPTSEDLLGYAYQLVNDDMFIEYATRHSYGSEQPVLSWESAKSYKALKPSNRLDATYSEFIVAVIEDILRNEMEIDALTKLRDSLLPLLMNCQVSVNYDLASIISQLHDVKKANFANHRGRQVTKFVYICAMRSVRARKAVEFCRKSRALSHENRAIFRTSCGIFAPFGHRAFAASTARTLPSPSTAPHRPTTGDTRLIYDIGRTPLYRQRHTPDRPRTPYIIYRTPAPWPACGYLGATPASTTPASCSHSPRPRLFSMRRTRLFGKIAYICAGAHGAGGKTIAFLRRNGEAPLNNRGFSARSPAFRPSQSPPSPHPPTVHRL